MQLGAGFLQSASGSKGDSRSEDSREPAPADGAAPETPYGVTILIQSSGGRDTGPSRPSGGCYLPPAAAPTARALRVVSICCCSSAFGAYPTIRLTNWPSLKIASVGILMMP